MQSGIKNKNICCRIFKEQIDLINQLPETERAVVLYEAVNYAFEKINLINQNENQIDNQNDSHFENQNENAYISVSVSDSVSKSVSVSVISKAVLELLKKNLVCKEFSQNYGGHRENSGRKVANLGRKVAQNPNRDFSEKPAKRFTKPTVAEVAAYFSELNKPVEAQEFCDFYESKGWKVGNSPMKDWKASVRNWTRHKTQGGNNAGTDYNKNPDVGKYAGFGRRIDNEV